MYKTLLLNLITHTLTTIWIKMPYKASVYIYIYIIKCTRKWLTIYFDKKEDISTEENRGDVANSNHNSAAMNPVCRQFGSGYWSRILLTPALPSTDAVPLPLPTSLPLAALLALPVPFLFPVAVLLVFPCDGSCHLLQGGLQVSFTVDIATSNEELALFLQHTLFTCQQKNLQNSWDREDKISRQYLCG